jgi:hypothetical protein
MGRRICVIPSPIAVLWPTSLFMQPRNRAEASRMPAPWFRGIVQERLAPVLKRTVHPTHKFLRAIEALLNALM